MACGEAVRISAITLDTFWELVRGQVIQELGEDGLSGIHPSLSAISVVGNHSPIAAGSADVISKSKNESSSTTVVDKCYAVDALDKRFICI